jgi:hypothetical protein
LEIFVNVKSAGKRKPTLQQVPYTVPDETRTLAELVRAIVQSEVERYNAKDEGSELAAVLLEQEIAEGEEVGKIGFGRLFNDKKADPEKAVGIALQGFNDGLWRVFRGDDPLLDLEAETNLKEGDSLTFLRLTFLSGRLW